jgi:rhamnogalacturonyl hydrolase YesR
MVNVGNNRNVAQIHGAPELSLFVRSWAANSMAHWQRQFTDMPEKWAR